MQRHLINQVLDPGDTVGAIGHRRSKVYEHHPRIMHTRTLVGFGQYLTDLWNALFV